jgi:hypothetical protein
MGKTLVREGRRLYLKETNEKEPKWVFCALRKKAIKEGVIPNNRDRILISECEKCSYFGGYQEHQVPSYCEDAQKRLPILTITRDMIKEEIQKAIEEEKQWLSSETHATRRTQNEEYYPARQS